VDSTPKRFFLNFLQDDSSSAPAVFSRSMHIPETTFDTNLVKIGYYGLAK